MHDLATRAKVGVCSVVLQGLVEEWGKEQCIGEGESVPLVEAVLYCIQYFRGRDVLWWIDLSLIHI